MNKIFKKEKKMQDAIIFCRVSSKDQAEEGYSIEAQQDRLREYCKRKNLNIIKEYLITESSTRGTRPLFREMIKFIKSYKKPIALVCDKVDRLQRNFKHVSVLDELRIKGKLTLHFNVENQILDANSSSSQIMAYQMYVMMAESYTTSLSENVRRAFEKMRKIGKITGTAPIGYLNVKNEDEHSEIILDPDRAIFIKKIFEDYATGLYSIKAIREKTKSWGLKNKTKSNTYLSISQIEKILKNPFYYGYATYKKQKYKHIYPRIIDEELFQKCEDVRLGRHKNRSNKTKKEFIFSGLMTCKHCGCTITPEIKKGKYVYLRPNPKNGCNCKQINENIALKEVEKVFSLLKIEQETLDILINKLKEDSKEQNTSISLQISALTKNLKNIETKENTLLDVLLNGGITQDVYNKKKEEFDKEKAKIERDIEKLSLKSDDFEITVKYLLDVASRAYKLFESSGIDEKRKLLKLVFPNFYLDGKKVSYTIKKPFNLMVKRANHPITLGRKDSNL